MPSIDIGPGPIRDAETTEGMADAEAKIYAWLKKYVDGHESESEIDVKLYEFSKREGLVSLAGPFPFDPAEDTLDDLVKDILAAAVEDVEEQKKTVRYAIKIEGREDKRTFTLKSTREKVDTLDDEDDFDDFDEPPTAKGQIALALDQSYRFGKMLAVEARSGRKLDRDIIKELRAENSQLKRQQLDTMRALERAHSQAFMRDLEVKKFEKSEARKDQIAGMAMQIGLPALIAHLSDGKVPMASLMRAAAPPPPPPAQAPPPGAPGAPPVEATIDPSLSDVRAAYDRRTGEQLDALTASMDVEQLGRIQAANVFTASQLEMLMGIFRTRMECVEAVAAARGGA